MKILTLNFFFRFGVKFGIVAFQCIRVYISDIKLTRLVFWFHQSEGDRTHVQVSIRLVFANVAHIVNRVICKTFNCGLPKTIISKCRKNNHLESCLLYTSPSPRDRG